MHPAWSIPIPLSETVSNTLRCLHDAPRAEEVVCGPSGITRDCNLHSHNPAATLRLSPSPSTRFAPPPTATIPVRHPAVPRALAPRLLRRPRFRVPPRAERCSPGADRRGATSRPAGRRSRRTRPTPCGSRPPCLNDPVPLEFTRAEHRDREPQPRPRLRRAEEVPRLGQQGSLVARKHDSPSRVKAHREPVRHDPSG